MVFPQEIHQYRISPQTQSSPTGKTAIIFFWLVYDIALPTLCVYIYMFIYVDLQGCHIFMNFTWKHSYPPVNQHRPCQIYRGWKTSWLVSTKKISQIFRVNKLIYQRVKGFYLLKPPTICNLTMARSLWVGRPVPKRPSGASCLPVWRQKNTTVSIQQEKAWSEQTWSNMKQTAFVN